MVRQTSVSTSLQVACRTSASSRASSHLGKPQKLYLRLSSRQDAVARATAPCDWTSILTEFKNKFGKHIPGKPPRQAPRFPTILLAAFEDMVLAVDKPVFLRVLSWWLLVQSWGTLRFDDHRGLLPREFVVTSTGLQARLTRSKVSGSDKHLNYRTVIIHPSAYIQRESWLSVGWKLLQEGASHEREIICCQHRRTTTRASKSKN